MSIARQLVRSEQGRLLLGSVVRLSLEWAPTWAVGFVLLAGAQGNWPGPFEFIAVGEWAAIMVLGALGGAITALADRILTTPSGRS